MTSGVLELMFFTVEARMISNYVDSARLLLGMHFINVTVHWWFGVYLSGGVVASLQASGSSFSCIMKHFYSYYPESKASYLLSPMSDATTDICTGWTRRLGRWNDNFVQDCPNFIVILLWTLTQGRDERFGAPREDLGQCWNPLLSGVQCCGWNKTFLPDTKSGKLCVLQASGDVKTVRERPPVMEFTF